MLKKIQKKLAQIPPYVLVFRLWFGLRLYFRKYFTLPVIIKTKRGSWIFLGLDTIDDIILKDLNTRLSSVYFPPELSLRNGEIVLDVGAHHGIFAMEIAAQFKGIKVISFEPDSASYSYLKMNAFLNKNAEVKLINAALGTEARQAFIVKSDEGSWGNYVQDRKIENSFKIDTVAVGDILKEYNLSSIAYAKFNAEGAEFSVIPELFRNNIYPKLMMLFAHPERGDVNELVENIRAHSYVLVRTNNDERRPWFLFQHQV